MEETNKTYQVSREYPSREAFYLSMPFPEEEVLDEPELLQPRISGWAPQPVVVGRREWLHQVSERFGFLIVLVLTLSFFTVLFVNSDWLLREPEKVSSSDIVKERPASYQARQLLPTPGE